MKKFHSTVSRREFMKGLGLAGAGLGAAAAAAPVYHDLDEVIDSPNAIRNKLPWYVKEVDKPTLDIDWNLMERYDQRESTFVDGQVKYWGAEEAARLGARVNANTDKFFKQGKPGFALRDKALASSASAMTGPYSSTSGSRNPQGISSFLGRRTERTPEQYGVPKWSGTPEENARMVRNAAKLFGACSVGFVKLESATTEKLIWSWDKNHKKVEFENVPEPYHNDTKVVIPNEARWVVIFYVQISQRMQQIAEGMGDITRSQAYSRFFNIGSQLQGFVRGLGYYGIGQEGNNSLTTKNAHGVMAGLAETGRFSYNILQGLGPMPRPGMIITNLPLEPSKPIDGGVSRFCHTCKKCAEHCPAQALSLETEPTYEVLGTWNMIGYKRWQYHAPRCRGGVDVDGQLSPCNIGTCWNFCMRNCTFTKEDKAFIHDFVSATLATTSLFNPFLRTMDDFMGYGETTDQTKWGNYYPDLGSEDPTAWWENDLLAFGMNTSGKRDVK